MDFYTDFFTATALLDSIIKQPYIPGQIGQMGIFESKALAGTKLALEEQPANSAELLTDTPRGTPSKAATLVRRKVHTFDTKHYRKDGAVYADEVLNTRAAGTTGAREVIMTRRDETLAKLRRDIDLTHETLRVGVLNSPNNAFGSKPADAAIAVQTDATKTRQEILKKIIRPIEAALGGTPYSGIAVVCQDTYWEDLIANAEIRATYLNQVAAAELRGNPLDSVAYGGVNFMRYRGSGACDIASAKAVAFPTGVPGLFQQAFAPADTLDSIGAGALGSPYYATAYPIDGGNRGWHIEAQTNCVMLCTRPDAIITIAKS